ncbi:MAG: aminotransferase class V-fold PLP-dependent enzyme [Acidibacillus sp.]|uniref:cysteine desulfurase n=1 Tax=Sulfoacidibacillus ferrooxidans TaxID=2005001 RepID=A0A9X1V9E4_9BACL|nr:putative cysteine desulfurase [Sulfoacidibacillus ferrooxidans]MCY0894032.1 aminotransferase class V-fold PLP-dependent enzyme [Acidibacillus sp.]
MIYLDNASSSWPKPPQVAYAVASWIEHNGANAGRGSHRMAREAETMIAQTRDQVGKLFGIQNTDQIILLQNITEAINLTLFGLLEPGDHVLSVGLVHNSVRRPLNYLERQGVHVSYVQYERQNWRKKIKDELNSNTKLVVITHASNVTGEVLPLVELSEMISVYRKPNRKPYIFVDSAQTAGLVPIDVRQMGIDILAFTGHKSLYGPQGTGGLYLAPDIVLKPIIVGGGGGNAESPDAPRYSPDRYEPGTRNSPGIAGLSEGIKYVLDCNPEKLLISELQLLDPLIDQLRTMDGVHILGDPACESHVPVVAFTMDGFSSAELGLLLDRKFDIAVRSGLHCAPYAHEQQHTLKMGGAVRVSVGAFTTEQEVEKCIVALKQLHSETKM